jgi:hypothetical protein
MSEHDAELRQVVADQYGLPDGSAAFLRGTTVEELEQSASEFARLVGDRREPEPTYQLGDLFSAGARAERKAQLARLFSGRPPQPRDESGRWISTAERQTPITFDGGARGGPVPVTGPPEQEHGRWLLDVLARRSADRGAHF